MDGTLESLYVRAQDGNLAAMEEFCTNLSRGVLDRCPEPCPTFYIEPRSVNDPRQTSRHIVINRGGRVALSGEISATETLEHLEDIASQRVLTEIVVPEARRVAFVFVSTRNAGLKCKFFEVKDNEEPEPLAGGPLDYRSHREIIKQLIIHCLTFA